LALAVWISIKFDWWWLAPVCLLAVWNKESFVVFLPTLYPFFRLRASRVGSITQVILLGLLCLPTYLFIHLRFAHNPGGSVIFFLPDQLGLFLHPLSLLKLTQEVYGLPMLNGFTILPAALTAWTVWNSWPSLPPAFKRHTQIAAAINIPLYLLFSFPGEVRDLSLLYDSLLVLLAMNLKNWMEFTARQAKTGEMVAESGETIIARS
jgi:hypothetical protein